MKICNKRFPYLVLDIECGYHKGGSPCPWLPDRFLSSIGIQEPDGHTHIWFFNPLIGDDIVHLEEIQDYLNNTEVLVGHNIKFDATWLLHIGLSLPCKLWCTMVVEYMLHGQLLEKQSLNAVAASYGLGQKVDKMHEYWDAGVQTDKIPVADHAEYLTQDLELTRQIYMCQKPRVDSSGIQKVLDVSLELTKLLASVEYVGAPFNKSTALQFVGTADTSINQMEHDLLEISGYTFDPGSATQLSAVMYGGEYNEKVREEYEITLKSGLVKTKSHLVTKPVTIKGLGFKCPKSGLSEKTGKPSTSKNVIDLLVPTTTKQKEFLSVIKGIGNVRKMVSMIAGKNMDKGWLAVLGTDGRLHGNFNQTTTVTGRLSSTNPNMQNIPRKGTSPLKEVFQPSSSEFVIVNGDLAQIEWRVAAELSRDKVMLDELNKGVDIHSLNAVQIFHANPEDKDSSDPEKQKKFKDLRQASKTVSFRLLYGGSAKGFHADSRMPAYTLKEWEAIVDAFYKKYSGLAKWQKDVCQLASRQGYVRLPSGRIIPSPVVDLADPQSKKEWKRKLNNYPIQSFSADIINLAAVEVMKLLTENPGIKLILLVHDSLVFECHKDLAKLVIESVENVFHNLTSLVSSYYDTEIVVPLTGECEIGSNYGNTIPVTSQTVNETLKEILHVG